MKRTKRNRTLEGRLRRLRMPQALTLVLPLTGLASSSFGDRHRQRENERTGIEKARSCARRKGYEMKNVLSRLSGVRLMLAIASMFVGLSSTAYADPFLPEPEYRRTISGAFTDEMPGTTAATECDMAGKCAVTTVNASYTNHVQLASVTGVSGSLDVGANGFASVSYFFAVIGPVTESVPLKITPKGVATATAAFNSGQAIARSFITTEYPGLPIITKTACAASGLGVANFCVDPSTYSDPIFVNAIADGPFRTITVAAECEVILGACSAVMDPTVTFASGFDSTGFSIVFSPSPVVTGTVPEPASFLLLGSSILALIRIARQKRSDHNTTVR